MDYGTKEAWLNGPTDLQEADVEDVPVPGVKIRVRGLPAAYSNEAQSKALKMITGRRGEQVATVDTVEMEILQFLHGCVNPTFTEPEARLVAQKYGPAFKKVIDRIDELSGVDKEAIARANEQFQSGETEPGNGRAVSAVAGGDS